jgi:hypothetical protein
MVELRGLDGRLLARVSRDGRLLQIKRRSIVYEIDLVRTWVEGQGRVLCAQEVGGAHDSTRPGVAGARAGGRKGDI